MKKIYIALFLIIFLFGCAMQQIQEEKAKVTGDIPETTDISAIGTMDEELDIKSLETLEEDLEYIENI